MAPEFVARTGGSRWQSALPTGSRWQSALPTGSKWQSALPTGSKWVQAQPADRRQVGQVQPARVGCADKRFPGKPGKP